jgi:hypothetical protein
MQETTFWRRDLYDKAGSYVNTNYKLVSGYELWIRFSRFEKLYSVNNYWAVLGNIMSKCLAILRRKKIPKFVKFLLKLVKYPFYVYAMLDSKNKVAIDVSSKSNPIKIFGIFQ